MLNPVWLLFLTGPSLLLHLANVQFAEPFGLLLHAAAAELPFAMMAGIANFVRCHRVRLGNQFPGLDQILLKTAQGWHANQAWIAPLFLLYFTMSLSVYMIRKSFNSLSREASGIRRDCKTKPDKLGSARRLVRAGRRWAVTLAVYWTIVGVLFRECVCVCLLMICRRVSAWFSSICNDLWRPFRLCNLRRCCVQTGS